MINKMSRLFILYKFQNAEKYKILNKLRSFFRIINMQSKRFKKNLHLFKCKIENL